MRVDNIIENNKKIQENFKLDTDKGRQLAILSVLTDISETLALYVDIYASIYGREITLNDDKRRGK